MSTNRKTPRVTRGKILGILLAVVIAIIGAVATLSSGPAGASAPSSVSAVHAVAAVHAAVTPAGGTGGCLTATSTPVPLTNYAIIKGKTLPQYDINAGNARMLVVDEFDVNKVTIYIQELKCSGGTIEIVDSQRMSVDVKHVMYLGGNYRSFTVALPLKSQLIQSDLSVSTSGIATTNNVTKFKAGAKLGTFTFTVRDKDQALNDGFLNGFMAYIRIPGLPVFETPTVATAALQAAKVHLANAYAFAANVPGYLKAWGTHVGVKILHKGVYATTLAH